MGASIQSKRDGSFVWKGKFDSGWYDEYFEKQLLAETRQFYNEKVQEW